MMETRESIAFDLAQWVMNPENFSEEFVEARARLMAYAPGATDGTIVSRFILGERWWRMKAAWLRVPEVLEAVRSGEVYLMQVLAQALTMTGAFK